MKFISTKQIKDNLGEKVCLKGWVRNYRKASSKLRFIIFRDAFEELQCVASKPEMSEEDFEKIKKLSIETSLIIEGIPQKHPNKDKEYEFHLNKVKIIGDSPDYPISKKEHGTDFLMSNRHLWLRSKKQIAIQKIRHTVYYAICEFLNEHDFFRFDTPIFTPNACEGTTTLFELPYFDLGSAYLSQSGQLYLESGIMALGKVYDFGPVFRAEKSKTRKHLVEFWMMDAEAAFMTHEESMYLQQELIRFVINTCLEKNKKELEILERELSSLKKCDTEFKIITHRQAIDILKGKGFSIDYKEDFGAKEEEAITQDFGIPVFVEKWPKEIKAFYMKRDNENEDVVLGADLIAPEGFGEIIGGSERETDYETLKQRMLAENMSLQDYSWYLDLRKYGSIPHSGFGIGLERLVCWVSGIRHIRETIPFPRMLYRMYP